MLDFKKISRSVARRSKGISDPQIMHASRDWWLGIIGGATLVIVGGSYLWYLNQSYHKTTFITDSVTANGVSYQADTVARAVEIVKEKKTKFNQVAGTEEIIENTIDLSETETPTTTTETDINNENALEESLEENVVESEDVNEEVSDVQPMPSNQQSADGVIELGV